MDDKRIQLLREAKINKVINQLSIPAIIGLLVLAVYNIVDTMFVAWLGTGATAATQVVMPIVMLSSAIGLTFGMGGASYVSRLLGMDKKDEANKVATVSLVTSILVGLVFTLVALIFIEPLLIFFGASPDIMALSKAYGRYILLGSVFTMANMTMNNLLRSEGSAKLSMVGMAAGAVLNIVLDPLLIFGMDLGIEGAAIATTISQIITFLILFSSYLNHHSILKIHVKYFRPSGALYKEIFIVGIPTFLRQVLFSVSLGFLNSGAVLYGGADLLAAVGLVFKVSMVPMYVVFGIGQGFQPVAGYNYGAGDNKRVMDALKYTMFLSLVVTILSGTIFILFSQQILGVFKAADVVVKYGGTGIRYMAIAMIIMSISNTVGVFYQAIGKGKESLILSVARQGIFLIPIILLLPRVMGPEGILASQLIADVLTLILTGFMFVPFIKSGNMSGEIVTEFEG